MEILQDFVKSISCHPFWGNIPLPNTASWDQYMLRFGRQSMLIYTRSPKYALVSSVVTGCQLMSTLFLLLLGCILIGLSHAVDSG